MRNSGEFKIYLTPSESLSRQLIYRGRSPKQENVFYKTGKIVSRKPPKPRHIHNNFGPPNFYWDKLTVFPPASRHP